MKYKLDKLEEQQDLIFWQRAHVDQLTYGDHNTKYSQAFASERKKRNTIVKLKWEDGVDLSGEEGLKALITNYFSSLFTPMAGADADEILNHNTQK